jgi:hypothetical protein
MKKFYYLLGVMTALLLTVMACEKSSVGDELQMFQKGDVLLQKGVPADKVTICHYDNYLGESYQITISANGLNGHNGFGTEPRHDMDNFTPVDYDNDGIMDCADCALENNDLEASMKKIWYQDLDGDGYGNPDVFIKTCETRDGYVTDNTDCDDTDAEINPETVWYLDSDGDTFGDALNYLTQCETPEGYVADNTDCDDTNANFYPGVGLGLGSYVFEYDGTYLHDYTILSFDGTIFTGTGGYPAGELTYSYPYNQVLAGTVVGGVLSGTSTYENGSTWDFTGTVDDCGRIISLDSPWTLITE